MTTDDTLQPLHADDLATVRAWAQQAEPWIRSLQQAQASYGLQSRALAGPGSPHLFARGGHP